MLVVATAAVAAVAAAGGGFEPSCWKAAKVDISLVVCLPNRGKENLFGCLGIGRVVVVADDGDARCLKPSSTEGVRVVNAVAARRVFATLLSLLCDGDAVRGITEAAELAAVIVVVLVLVLVLVIGPRSSLVATVTRDIKL